MDTPEQRGPKRAQSPRETLLEMNREIRAAMDLARELRDDVRFGRPLDGEKLRRIRELAEHQIELKQTVLRLLPSFETVSFRDVYRELAFIDALISHAENLIAQLERSPDPDQLRDSIRHMLRVIEGEMRWLREQWEEHANPGFDSAKRNIDAARARLDEQPLDIQIVFELVYALRELKLFFAGALPARVYDKDLGFWYTHFRDLDAWAGLIDFYAENVERRFNEETTAELDDMLFRLEVSKIKIEEVVPE